MRRSKAVLQLPSRLAFQCSGGPDSDGTSIDFVSLMSAFNPSCGSQDTRIILVVFFLIIKGLSTVVLQPPCTQLTSPWLLAAEIKVLYDSSHSKVARSSLSTHCLHKIPLTKVSNESFFPSQSVFLCSIVILS
jgi:hypothetical protein